MLSKWQYESVCIRLNVPSLSNKKSLVLCLSVTVSLVGLLILIIILISPSPSNINQTHSPLLSTLSTSTHSIKSKECRTVTNESCVFPFSYRGVEYGECSTIDNAGVLWCSTATDHVGHYVEGKWGQCASDCPAGDTPMT